MQNTYVMGDIHGNYRALIKCLESVNFDYENDKLIQLGDVVDRGEDSFMCIETLLKIKNLIPIKGNHDDWWLTFILTGKHPSLNQGGRETRQSYFKHLNNNEPCYNSKLVSLIPESHIKFFTNQLSYYVDDNNNCFVHGGFNRHHFIEAQYDDYIYYWDRDLWNIALSNHDFGLSEVKTKNNFKEIFIGHTPTIYWSMNETISVGGIVIPGNVPCTTPMKKCNIWNLDTGCGKGDYPLTIMNLYTKEYKQFR